MFCSNAQIFETSGHRQRYHIGLSALKNDADEVASRIGRFSRLAAKLSSARSSSTSSRRSLFCLGAGPPVRRWASFCQNDDAGIGKVVPCLTKHRTKPA